MHLIRHGELTNRTPEPYSDTDNGGVVMNDSIKVGMAPCHPGEFVREEVLATLNLSITRAAEILGLRRATLSDVINEKSSLSPEMALRLEKAFGLDMETLLRMQAWHDTFVMRKRAATINVQRFLPAVSVTT